MNMHHLLVAGLAMTGCKISTSGLVGDNQVKSANDSDEVAQAAPKNGDGKSKRRGKKPWVDVWDGGSSGPAQASQSVKVDCKPANENDVCNGKDDDCDGLIDEECGFKSNGGLQVVAAWDGPHELDLVIEYDGADGNHGSMGHYTYHRDEISGGDRRSGYTIKNQMNGEGSCACKRRVINGQIKTCGAGCELKRGKCWARDNLQYAENVYSDTEKAPPGRYKIMFANNARCGAMPSEEASVTLSVAVDGQTLGTWRSNDIDMQTTPYPVVTLHVP